MEKNQWIYFLKITPQLPDSFFQLNSQLMESGINLLPVELDQLATLSKIEGSQFTVILCLTQFSELKLFEKRVRKVLQRMLDLLGFELVLLTSFDRLLVSGKGAKKKSVVRFVLPVSLKLVSAYLSVRLAEKYSRNNKWEWGRSPLLSSDVVSQS